MLQYGFVSKSAATWVSGSVMSDGIYHFLTQLRVFYLYLSVFFGRGFRLMLGQC